MDHLNPKQSAKRNTGLIIHLNAHVVMSAFNLKKMFAQLNWNFTLHATTFIGPYKINII